MGELGNGGGSSYPTTLDTYNVPEVDSPAVGKTKARADVPNDLGAAIIALETEIGTSPSGSIADIKTYLQIEHGTDGTHADITATSIASSGAVTLTNGQLRLDVGADIASDTALILGTDGNFFDVTGTTTITSIATVGVGTEVTLQFDEGLILTHDATNLILPTGVNITTVAGDIAIFYEYATGDWRCTSYSPFLSGARVQSVITTDSGVATGATVLPVDDSIPQITEGDEYMTVVITPKETTNKLVIEFLANLGSSATNPSIGAALFQDSTAGALKACLSGREGAADTVTQVRLEHEMTAGTTSATTFRVRAGTGGAGTTTFNGISAGRLFGGVMGSYIRVTEYKL